MPADPVWQKVERSKRGTINGAAIKEAQEVAFSIFGRGNWTPQHERAAQHYLETNYSP